MAEQEVIRHTKKYLVYGSADKIRQYNKWIFNTTGLVPNSGRFEGFKSSGKIGNSENKELQNNTMDLYQGCNIDW